MPRAVGYTPAWLSKPNPGHEIFTARAANAPGTQIPSSNGFSTSRKGNSKPGPHRTIARRGTEVFIAVGKEIRWADLVYLKEAWEESQQKGKTASKDTQYDEDHAQGYRTIKTHVGEDIRQLIISPHANYLAILTTHTVHIAVLPDPSHLTAPDTGPMRLKSYTLGPTTHITTQPSIASALWHPLGVNGSCLVTVTEDAIVRVWELSTADRWSFDRPTIAIDLKKLADGTSLDQDFGASVTGGNTAFTPDSVEMEVASACFGGNGSGGWAPMTLWVAMREGDVYALCPLLPDKFSPPPTLIPSLSISIVAKVAAIEDDRSIPDAEKRLAQQQLAWMSDLDVQEPMHVEAPLGYAVAEVYTRPTKPGKVPRLQGPFDLELAPDESEDELDSLLTDILVVGARMDSEQLMFGEEDDIELDEIDEGGLSLSIVCLLTSSGRLSICLDLDGVQAQWLPTSSKSKHFRLADEADPPSLLTFQVLDTSRHEEVWEGNWPMFSEDVHSRYSFYITDTSSVTFISLSPWVDRLESEFRDGTAGTDFRIDLLAKGHGSIRERVYTQKANDHSSPLSASTLIRDPDLGYFLLTATPYGPIAVTFETPEVEEFEPMGRSRSPTYDPEPDKPLILCEPRPVYQPAHALEENSALPSFLEKLRHSKYKRLLKEEIKLSPATLTIMTDAHKVLSEETHRLGTAAAELFRKCERLQIELQSHIKKLNEVAGRVEAVTMDDDCDDGPVISTNEAVEKRIQKAAKRQEELAERIERVKRKASKGTSRELTDREAEWFQEVTSLREKVLGEGEGDELSQGRAKEPWARYEEVSHLKDELLEQAKDLSEMGESPTPPSVKVPSGVRKAKVAQIMTLLDRESALVEGAKNRLEKLRATTNLGATPVNPKPTISSALNRIIRTPPSADHPSKAEETMAQATMEQPFVTLSSESSSEGSNAKSVVAAIRAFPNRWHDQSRYREVSVLLLRWEDDEMGVEWEVDDLEKVFMCYGYNTERWLIPTKSAHLELMARALDIVKKHNDQGDLLIVYYAGHGFINPDRKSTWCCKSDPSYASVEWSAIQTIFEQANLDVLLLFDCCAAASAAPTAGSAVTETIAACGFESIAPQPGRHSFTNALIEVLTDWKNSGPFSAAQLHTQLLLVLKHEKPEVSRRGKKIKLECRRTPIHILAATDPRHLSIELGRRVTLDSENEPPIAGIQESPSKGEDPGQSTYSPLIPTAVHDKNEEYYKLPRVIISLSLETHQTLNSDTCERWLSACPTLVEYATVEAVYTGFSALVLLSVPICIWDLLEDDPACSFVGYVTSTNLHNRSYYWLGDGSGHSALQSASRPGRYTKRFDGSISERDSALGSEFTENSPWTPFTWLLSRNQDDYLRGLAERQESGAMDWNRQLAGFPSRKNRAEAELESKQDEDELQRRQDEARLKAEESKKKWRQGKYEERYGALFNVRHTDTPLDADGGA
ncbi:uncharacterized protein BP5553_07480 [Venustampulla echinocandica]|uniref:Peptidase C14 caspase domain-containing protein n=1 Tax=Venustampulla echinocandica TaxID=2656787 RepID=A0A370TGM4_9HELO|nr:uncharacterized protein BP5553_07480 [Venustampulla echinocandica]RDL34352.1 hypothetical protein BP5553_07480 [Venustampulla echinocandica]